MMGLEMQEGRSFSRDHADSAKVVFNEAAIEVMGLNNPVGKTINMDGYKLEIVGVVKNFHFESLHSKVSPLFFMLVPQYTQKVIAKISNKNQSEVIQNLQKFYSEFNPGFAFDYKFLDQDYQAQYGAEMRVASLSKYFAGIAILISCLGLFGLAAFTTERRSKEMGIRKVLGSTEWNIVYLLSIDFTKIVFVAIVIALPISYLIAKNWLDSFAYKVPLSGWYFIGAGFAALVIAWLTVGSQAIKAARINPAQCLKDD